MKKIDKKSIISIILLNFTAIKMMLLPSLCTANIGGSSFIFVLMMFVFEIVILAMLLHVAKSTNQTFFETVQDIFGKVIGKIIVAIYFIYFLINTFAVIESLYLYLSEHLYSRYEWIQYIIPLFLMIFFVSTTRLDGMTRTIQFLVPFTILCIFLSVFLGAINCDFTNCLPLFEKGADKGLNIFNYSYWFGDGLIMMLYFGRVDNKKSTNTIILWAFIISLVITFFYLIFYCIYEADTINNKEAITDVLKVLPQNSDVGSVNWVITVLWHAVLLSYICLNAFTTRMFFEGLVPIKNPKISISIVLALIFAGLLVINFDMVKLLTFLVIYTKYFAIACQYILPVIITIGFAIKNRRKHEKVYAK